MKKIKTKPVSKKRRIEILKMLLKDLNEEYAAYFLCNLIKKFGYYAKITEQEEIFMIKLIIKNRPKDAYDGWTFWDPNNVKRRKQFVKQLIASESK
jgi:predicted methyltransferase